MKIDLLSVNVGMPEVIGVRHGENILSGIRKQPVTSATVAVGLTGLDGDGQADLRVHGGFEKPSMPIRSSIYPSGQGS